MNEIFLQPLLEQIHKQTWLDWAITLTAISYVVLAARENIWCWVFGIISCSLWAYADFVRYNLWADGLLQIFYVILGGWGLYNWGSSTEKGGSLPISRMSKKDHARAIFSGACLSITLGYFFHNYTPTALPYPDSFVTGYSIVATYLNIRKKLENWLYWIVLDTLAIFLFWSREAVLAAFVMGIYTLVAVKGYALWKKKLPKQANR